MLQGIQFDCHCDNQYFNLVATNDILGCICISLYPSIQLLYVSAGASHNRNIFSAHLGIFIELLEPNQQL